MTAGVLAAMLVTLPGCARDAGSGAASTAATTPTAVVAAPSSTPLSAIQREAISPDPNIDIGLLVQITAHSFRPQTLIAPCCQPITWRNLSSMAIAVYFDALQVNSGPIPPGGTWVFTPHNVEAIAYHSLNDPSITGSVQVNQNQES
jgi:hypothetical protein